MKLTNHFNLPQPIYDAVKNDPYSKGDADISVTELLKPARIVALEKLHHAELEEDASDRIWSLVGQVMHSILERADQSGAAERRITMQIDDWKISGGIDRYVDGVIQDYKFVTAYKFKNNQVPLEFEQQLNCYAHLVRSRGEPVHKLELVGILRDWSKLEAKREPNYPQHQVLVLPVPLWEESLALAFIRSRLNEHDIARNRLPECSEEERWAKPAQYAVMKPGRKAAVRLFETELVAKSFAKNDDTYYIVHRPGQNVRCESYCGVAKFCTQIQTINEERGLSHESSED